MRRPCPSVIAIFSSAVLLATSARAFELSSPDVKAGRSLAPAQVFNGFGCSGGNASPALTWKDPPAGTKSFAVTVYDPDAPTGSGWWHWIVFDLPADARALAAGARAPLPGGARQARNDFGSRDFGGACPPPGAKPHRYVFTVHALKVEKLDVPEDASAALLGFLINANRLGKATLTARHGR